MTETITRPLRDEHAHLRPHIEGLRAAGDAVGAVEPELLRAKVADAYRFLTHHLGPHAEAEDKVLYAEIDHLLGDVPVTATMRRDHVEIARLTDRLGMLEPQLAGHVGQGLLEQLRATLYGLHAVIELHFAKEEEIYLPLLDQRLTAERAAELFGQMKEIEHSA